MWNLHLYPGNKTRMTLRFYLVLFKGKIIIKGSISATRTLYTDTAPSCHDTVFQLIPCL